MPDGQIESVQPYQFTHRDLRYIGLAILMLVGLIVFVTAIFGVRALAVDMFPPILGNGQFVVQLTIAAGVAVLLAVFILGPQIICTLVDVAMARKWNLRRAWNQTRGDTARFGVLYTFPWILAGAPLYYADLFMFGNEPLSMAQAMVRTLDAILVVGLSMVTAAALALVYRQLDEVEAPSVPSVAAPD